MQRIALLLFKEMVVLVILSLIVLFILPVLSLFFYELRQDKLNKNFNKEILECEQCGNWFTKSRSKCLLCITEQTL